MKRNPFALLLLFLLVWLSLPLNVSAKSYWAERYDVDLTIQPGGRLDVTEEVVLRFDGGPFTFFFRELEYNRLDGVANVRAYLDGALLPEGSGAGQVEIERERGKLRATWHMPPTSDAARTFRLEYTVLGAVRANPGADEIVWRAVPEDHDYEISRSQVTLRYPDGVQPLSAPRLDGANASAGQLTGGAVFTVQGVDEDDSLDVSIAFPSGSLVSGPPAWQLAQEQQRRETTAAIPYGLGAAALVGLLGTAALMGFYQRTRRDDLPPLSYSSQQQTPPSDIPPALAAKLRGSGDPALATLFDLAQRGVLEIVVGQGMLRSKKFELAYIPGGEILRPHEQALVDALFTDKHGTRESISFNELGSRLSSNHKAINAPLDALMASYGWKDPERERQRNRLIGVSVMALLLGPLVAVAAVLPLPTLIRAVLVGTGAAMFVLGFVGTLSGAMFSTLTASGMQQASAWQSFERYLKDVSRGREPAIRPDAFSLYLPYAAGFGLASGWARFFENQPNVPVPPWLNSLEQAGVRFSDVSAAIIASQAATSSSASGGAAGASGGGSSGAG